MALAQESQPIRQERVVRFFIWVAEVKIVHVEEVKPGRGTRSVRSGFGCLARRGCGRPPDWAALSRNTLGWACLRSHRLHLLI